MAIIPQTQSFKLFGAGASIGATSITLQSFKNLDGSNLTMAHFGGTKGFLTIEPSSGDQEEQVSFASITNNANGTVTLGTVKTVLDYTPFTETSGLAKTHGGNVEVIVSNTSGFYNDIVAGTTASQIINVPAGNIAATNVQTAINELDTEGLHKAGAESVTGVKTFDSTTGRPKLSADVDTAVNEEIPTWGQVARTASAGASNGSTTVKGIYQTPSSAEVLAGTATGSTGAELALTVANTGTTSGKIPVVQSNGKLATSLVATKYGGTGADGALAISSGTTTINVGGAALYILNYTSVSITGTGSLAFSNPNANGTVVIIKSQGDITLTSSGTAINVAGMGASSATDGSTWSFIKTNKGVNSASSGGGGGSITAGTAGSAAGGAAASLAVPTSPISIHLCKYPNAFVGAGGGTSLSGAAAGGN